MILRQLRTRRWPGCAVTVGIAVAGLILAPSIADAHTAAGGGQHLRASALAKVLSSSLTAVSVVPGSTDAWAVGSAASASSSAPIADWFHHNKWSKVAMKAPKNAVFTGIAAASAHSIWATGEIPSLNVPTPVLMHSTGGTFRRVKVPGIGGGDFIAAAATSPSNVWVVGIAISSLQQLPIALHWNGKKWSQTTVSATAYGLALVSVSSSGPNNTWALGDHNGALAVFQWTGKAWTNPPITVDPAAANTQELAGIATTSSTDAWTAGTHVTTNFHETTQAYTWSGAAWGRSKIPRPSSFTVIHGVSAVGNRAYVVGNVRPKTGVSEPIAMVFSGGSWQLQRVQDPKHNSYLQAVASSTKLTIAVGARYDGNDASDTVPLAEVLHGHRWTDTSSPPA
jgi:hypothetical protein